MKYIKLEPKEVQLTNLTGVVVKDEYGEHITVTFKNFLLERLVDDTFTKGAKSLMLAFDIKQAIDRADTVLVLENDQYSTLKSVLESPKHSFGHGLVAHSYVPFIKAFLEKATDTDPTTTKSE
jgi:hypothetical protein